MRADWIRRNLRLACVVVSLSFFVSCNENPTGPSRPSYALESVQIGELGIFDTHTQWAARRSVVVFAQPADTTTAFPLDARVAALLRTSAGDAEPILLSRHLCDASLNTCHSLNVLVDGDFDSTTFAEALASREARVSRVTASGLSFSIFSFEPSRTHSLRGWVSRQRGVRSAQISQWGICGLDVCYSPRLFTTIVAGLPLELRISAATPGGGTLEVAPGDSVYFEVPQPDGTVRRSIVVVPPLN